MFRTKGDAALVQPYDNLLLSTSDHWLSREITLYLKRTLKRLDVSSRSLVALVGAGQLLCRHAVGTGPGRRPLLHAGRSAGGRRGTSNGSADRHEFRASAHGHSLTRVEGRFLDSDELEEHIGRDLDAEAAYELGLRDFHSRRH